MPLYRLFHTVNVVSLQEPRLGSVNVTRMEAIYSALVGRLFISEFLIDAHQLLQVLTFYIDVDVYEASFELFHLIGLNQVLEVLREVIVDLVFLKVLLEEVLHHLIILIKEDSDVVLLTSILVQKFVTLDGGSCYISLLLDLNLLNVRVIASHGRFWGHGMVLLIAINGINVGHGVKGINLVLPSNSECHFSLYRDLNNEYGALIQLADHRDLPSHQTHKLV
jgi:hypothetical protein